MFSIRTRRRIVTGLIVLVYVGILAFVPLVMWPAIRENREDIEDLRSGRDSLKQWNNEMKKGEFQATRSHVEATQARLAEVRQSYETMKQWCMERDRILERSKLLNKGSQYNFKQDYLSLVNLWQELNSTEQIPGAPEDGLAVTPQYEWAGEAGAMPPKEEYPTIIKQTAVIDAVVRIFNMGEADFTLTEVMIEPPQESKNLPRGPGDTQFGAARYELWPVTVKGLVPFSTDYRPTLARVATAPTHVVQAPARVDREKVEPRYVPTFEEDYNLPCVKIRSLNFKPTGINWMLVEMQLDIYDFSAQEPRE